MDVYGKFTTLLSLLKKLVYLLLLILIIQLYEDDLMENKTSTEKFELPKHIHVQ